ncbi:MAG: chloride channel protein [Acidimicrobiales bacterium]|nr:chloride channel protein [Acidimicrobiales bacterium]
MASETPLPSASGDEGSGLVRLSLVAALGGIGVGIVGGAFRQALLHAGDGRRSFLSWAGDQRWVGWVLVVAVVAAGAALARALVRLVPVASGSGVQHVEAVWRGEVEPTTWLLLPVKFAGAVVGIGSGLVLGREGPTIHMGAVIGSEAGRAFSLDADDRRLLQTALGGAGLAVAFNAPLAGAVFVFEEVARSFRLRLALPTLIGSATAIACSRGIVADQPDFLVAPVARPSGWMVVTFVVFGLVTGVLGIAYNRLIVAGVDLFARFPQWSPEARAAVVGGVVGLVLWFDPLLAGGGDVLAQRVLDGGITTLALAGYLTVRFLIGPWSYSAGTPGGLFAPLLAVGAVWGALAARVVDPVWPAAVASPAALAMVGMAAFFAAVVRAPLTGMVLIVEMTAVTSLLVPMLAACFAAVLVATLVGAEPIYDSLRARLPRVGEGA